MRNNLSYFVISCKFGEEGRESIREILEDHQRGRVLDELDEDDSDGEDEDDDEVGVSLLLFLEQGRQIYLHH